MVSVHGDTILNHTYQISTDPPRNVDRLQESLKTYLSYSLFTPQGSIRSKTSQNSLWCHTACYNLTKIVGPQLTLACQRNFVCFCWHAIILQKTCVHEFQQFQYISMTILKP